MMRRRRRCIGAGLLAATLTVFAATPVAFARRGVRPLFEPTDLELEPTGSLDVDLQIGVIRSQGPYRLVIPDFEFDFGLLPNLEIDLDGAYAIEGPQTGPFSLDHAAPDSLWLSVKVGFLDWNDDEAHSSWAVGAQMGPKMPIQSGSHGLGVEALLLVGHAFSRTHLVLNTGAFVDPAPDASSGRPTGIELGLDVDRDLDSGGRFSLKGELSGVWFLSDDPRQLLATLGPAWAVTPNLDVSLIALWGFWAGSDRYGLLVGVSPKFRLFH
jgi:hypothetical protein